MVSSTLLSCSSSKPSTSAVDSPSINVLDYIDLVSEDHSAGFQAAMDAAFASEIKRVYIPAGNYLLDNIKIYPGLEIYGDGRGKTILKKLPMRSKFSRMFTIQKQKVFTTDTTKIYNCEFDGSRLEQGPYRRHQRGHQAMVFMSASNVSTAVLHVKVDNCYFHDGCGDAVSLHRNVNATITNCEAKDVFRGGVTLTGGNSTLVVKNLKAWGDEHDSGVDIEIDGRGFGGSRAVDITMEDVWLGGDFDISTGRGGSFYGNNIHCDNPPVRMIGGPIVIENSTFNCAYTKSCYINFPRGITFNNCTFNIHEGRGKRVGYQAAFNIFWSKPKRKPDNLALTFNNCKVDLVEKDKDMRSYFIVNSPQSKGKNNRLYINDCEITGDLDATLLVRGNGNYSINNTTSTALRNFDVNDRSTSPEIYDNASAGAPSYRIYYKDGRVEDF